MTDPDLDRLFAAARAADPAPSEALVARVMADAVALQPRPASSPQARAPQRLPRNNWLQQLSTLFGGSGALAGVSLAVVAGVFVGVVQPAPVAALTSALLVEAAAGTVDLLPADAAWWEDLRDE